MSGKIKRFSHVVHLITSPRLSGHSTSDGEDAHGTLLGPSLSWPSRSIYSSTSRTRQ